MTIKNSKMNLTLFDQDETNGTLFRLVNKNENVEYVFAFDFQYYKPYQGDDKPASGAYIFRPDDQY